VRLLAVLGGVDGASVDAAWCKLIERHDFRGWSMRRVKRIMIMEFGVLLAGREVYLHAC
jgi:hypothetical protein